MRIVLSALMAVATTLIALPAAALTISPAGGAPGAVIDIVLHEPGVVWEPDVEVAFEPGVSVLDLQRLWSGALHARIAIDGAAAPGFLDVAVQDAVHSIVAPELFAIGNCTCDGGTPVNANVVVNPGFETGDLTGWIPSTWSVSGVMPHGGSFDAYDPGGSGGGGGCIRQNFAPPIDSDDINSFTFWLRQIDDAGIAQVIVFHQVAGSSVGVAFPNANDTWAFQDHTNLVMPNDMVTGFHVCGFGGGTPTADDSWVDDFALDTGATPVQSTTWGAIKAIMR